MRRTTNINFNNKFNSKIKFNFINKVVSGIHSKLLTKPRKNCLKNTREIMENN